MIRNKGKTCSVIGCQTPAYCRGWCYLHYKRWTHTGDPVTTFITPKGERLSTLLRLMEIETDVCVLWPFAPTSSGYGAITIDNRTIATHVYVCTATYGERPDSKLHAAHRCGKKLCVNKRHIRWTTAKENAADKVLHGTNAGWQKKARAKEATA